MFDEKIYRQCKGIYGFIYGKLPITERLAEISINYVHENHIISLQQGISSRLENTVLNRTDENDERELSYLEYTFIRLDNDTLVYTWNKKSHCSLQTKLLLER